MNYFKHSFYVSLLSLAVFIVNCQAEDAPPELHFLHGGKKPELDKCLAESGLTQDDLKVMIDDPQAEPTMKQLCFGKCLAESVGFLKVDGTVNFDLIEKEMTPAIDAATISTMIKCMEDAGKVTTCDDMSKIIKCKPTLSKQ